MIEIKELTKKYNKEYIFRNLNLKINDNECVLFIGTNGSGKSTLLNIIAGNISHYEGIVKRNGSVFYLPEKLILPHRIKAYSFLNLYNKIVNSISLDSYIKKYKLPNKRIGSLSKGNLQKIGIIAMLISNVDILLLDEPLEGLDQEIIKILILDLKELHQCGKTILISTHQPKEYKKLCPIEVLMENIKYEGN